MTTYEMALETARNIIARKAQRVRNYPYTESDIRIWKHENDGAVRYVYTVGHDEAVYARECGAVLVTK